MKEQAKQFRRASLPISRKKKWRLLAWAAVGIAAGAGVVIWLWPDGLVSLNVKDADVKKVLQSIARQSRQTILVAPDTTGKVTIRIRKKSVWEALDIVAVQTSSFWREYYAVGDSKDSIEALKRSLVDGTQAEGWASLRGAARFGGGFGRFIGGMSGAEDTPPNQPITYEAAAKPATEVAMALNFRTQARVVVCDSLGSLPVSVNFAGVSPERAVADFARELGGRVEHFFVVRPFGRDRTGGRPQENPEDFPQFSPLGRSGRPFGPRPQQDAGSLSPQVGTLSVEPGPSLRHEQREQRRAEFEKARAAWLEAMTPEQRQQAEQIRAQFEQLQQQTATMTPEQRRQVFQQTIESMQSNPQVQQRRAQRAVERIKNTTPEQQVELYRRIMERRKQAEQRRAQQQQQQPSPPPQPQPQQR